MIFIVDWEFYLELTLGLLGFVSGGAAGIFAAVKLLKIIGPYLGLSGTTVIEIDKPKKDKKE